MRVGGSYLKQKGDGLGGGWSKSGRELDGGPPLPL
jgi:hypothetical protein